MTSGKSDQFGQMLAEDYHQYNPDGPTPITLIDVNDPTGTFNSEDTNPETGEFPRQAVKPLQRNLNAAFR